MGGESTVHWKLAAPECPTGSIILREGGVIVVLLRPASVVHGPGSSAV